MEIIDWRDLPVISNPHNLDIRQLYDHPKIQVRQIILRSGHRLKPFVSPEAALIFVNRGSVVVQSGEAISNVTQGKLIVCPAGVPTTLFNNSDEEARNLAIRAPKPTVKSLLL
jgi:quercetin dioxygenase-like cupin family protein